MLRLPEDVAERVDSGEIKATAAYEIAKLQIADDQRIVADAVVAGDLDHKATVAAVARQRESSRSAARPKGKGGSKASPKLPSERPLKVAGGLKVVVSGRKGFDVLAWVEALRDALDQATAKLEPAEQGGEAEAAA